MQLLLLRTGTTDEQQAWLTAIQKAIGQPSRKMPKRQTSIDCGSVEMLSIEANDIKKMYKFGEALPLPCGSTAVAAKTLPFVRFRRLLRLRPCLSFAVLRRHVGLWHRWRGAQGGESQDVGALIRFPDRCEHSEAFCFGIILSLLVLMANCGCSSGQTVAIKTISKEKFLVNARSKVSPTAFYHQFCRQPTPFYRQPNAILPPTRGIRRILVARCSLWIPKREC